MQGTQDSVDILAMFAYVNDQSGIYLKIVGQKTSSSPDISMRSALDLKQ